MYIAKLIKHKGENRIAVYFENKTELIARFKKLKGAKWSATLRVWHLPDSEESRQKFKLKIRENTKPENQLSAEVQLQKEKFVQWLRSKRYSESTIKTYSDAIRVFLHFFQTRR